MKPHPFLSQLVGSPACLPEARFGTLFPIFRDLGLQKFEGFSEWAGARFDWSGDPQLVLLAAQKSGMQVSSFHLPVIKSNDVESGFQKALKASRYASALGAEVVLLKGETKEVLGQIGKRFLDALQEEGLPLTTVVQNHKGSAIATIQDYEAVFSLLDDDPRMKAVLEVGHFQRVGIDWRTGWEYLADRVSLIHINDISHGESVPYGTGEVDFPGLIKQIKKSNYTGNIVVELELGNDQADESETLDTLKLSIELLLKLYSAE